MNKDLCLHHVDLSDVFLQDPSAYPKNTSKQPLRNGAGAPHKKPLGISADGSLISLPRIPRGNTDRGKGPKRSLTKQLLFFEFHFHGDFWLIEDAGPTFHRQVLVFSHSYYMEKVKKGIENKHKNT